MLRWQFQPDEAFVAILDSSLRTCIDQLGDYLSDHLAGTTAEVEFAWLDGTRIWKLFNPSQLLGELQKLLTAHRSAKLYMPSDYHFLILHEVLELQIRYHNDRVSAYGQPLAFGSVLLGQVDFDFVRDYFWDEDFLLDPEVMASLSEENKAALGFNQETFALVQELKPHPQELELQEVDAEPESGQNYYKRDKCYPYDELQPG
jgi:hypothetical protein